MTNVELIKAMYAAYGRGDIQTIMDHVADDVVWEAEGPAEMSFTGIRKGKQETLGFFTGLAAEHADPKLEMTEFISEGEGVAALGRYSATIKTTGRRVDSPVGHFFRVKDGKVVRYVNLINSAAFVDAAKAAGA